MMVGMATMVMTMVMKNDVGDEDGVQGDGGKYGEDGDDRDPDAAVAELPETAFLLAWGRARRCARHRACARGHSYAL